MLVELNDSDWDEAFKYAKTNVEPVIGDSVHADPFTEEDVTEILVLMNGENDEDNWLGVFRLRDERFATLSAWCDYTGWG